MSREMRIHSDLMALEVITEKMEVILNDLLEDYFENDALIPVDKGAQIYHKQAEIRLHIIQDYMAAIEETIESMTNNLKGGVV